MIIYAREKMREVFLMSNFLRILGVIIVVASIAAASQAPNMTQYNVQSSAGT